MDREVFTGHGEGAGGQDMITSLQHVGIGVRNVDSSLSFWSELMGFRLKLGDRASYMEEMRELIGSLVELRVVMAANLRGGGAVELVEHLSTSPREPAAPVCWGDIGYLEVGLKAYRLEELYQDLRRKGVGFLTPVREIELASGQWERFAYLRDPDGNLVHLVEEGRGRRPAVGGVRHLALGVRDLERSERFYREVLNFRREVNRFRGRLPELESVCGEEEMEVVVLAQVPEGRPRLPLLEPAMLKLVHTPRYRGRPIFEGRRWGDVGIMEMALDVVGLEERLDRAVEAGAELVQPPTAVDLGMGTRGCFAYLRDPDGNLVELCEAERVLWNSPALLGRVLGWGLGAVRRRLLS
ncbi:MAG: VOC family protein [Candidatus Geothermincolales bacterium]